MHRRGKLALAVVTGGVFLGAVLGAAVNPEMKHRPEPPQQAALQSPADADLSSQLADTWPRDFSEGRDRDSYPPAWASGEVTNWEPQYPAWTYSEGPDEPAEPVPISQPDKAAAAPPEPAAPETLAPKPRGLAPLY